MKAQPYNFKPIHSSFTANMLEIGEMMEVIDSGNPAINGHILLRSFNVLISLSNPRHTWSNIHTVNILGRKLNSGEGITLIQE